MRLLLLLASLLGLLPQHTAMAHGGEHCVTPGHVVADSGTPPAHGHDTSHEECSHCPPARCAVQPHCAQPATAHPTAGPVATDVALRATAGAREAATRWSSRDHAPPVPPPLTHLT